MCRDILNSCVRNTEEAERSSQQALANGHGSENKGGSGSGRGLGKGVWGMIEESELAKTIRRGEEKEKEKETEREVRSCYLSPSEVAVC